VGLPETNQREWLLDIDFRKRETYACEAYSRILEAGSTLGSPTTRAVPSDERVLPTSPVGGERAAGLPIGMRH